MQIISPFHTRKSYTKEAVTSFIEQYGLKVKYYGSYKRKNFIPVDIYRYYDVLSTGQKKLFLFCRRFCLVENKNLCIISSN